MSVLDSKQVEELKDNKDYIFHNCAGMCGCDDCNFFDTIADRETLLIETQAELRELKNTHRKQNASENVRSS